MTAPLAERKEPLGSSICHVHDWMGLVVGPLGSGCENTLICNRSIHSSIRPDSVLRTPNLVCYDLFFRPPVAMVTHRTDPPGLRFSGTGVVETTDKPGSEMQFVTALCFLHCRPAETDREDLECDTASEPAADVVQTVEATWWGSWRLWSRLLSGTQSPGQTERAHLIFCPLFLLEPCLQILTSLCSKQICGILCGS